MYVITGASGNTGRPIAEAMLKAGKQVRVIGRDRDKLADLVARGAEEAVGDLTDVDFATQAFRGATAVYALLPPDLRAESLRAFQNRVGTALTTAVRENGVHHVVFLSSLGADLGEGMGPVTGLYDQEQRWGALAHTNVLSLRPAYFMENLYGQIPMIKGQKIMGGPIRGDVKFPMIATRDIAAVAAEALLHLDFKGYSVRELRGAADVSYDEAAHVIGEVLREPKLKYVLFPYDAAEQGMVEMGLSRDVARSFVELGRAVNEGRGIAAKGRTKANTTPTTLFQFAETFAQAYRRA